jgi:putative DNA primase/helicase
MEIVRLPTAAERILKESGLNAILCSDGWHPDVEDALRNLGRIVQRNNVDPLTLETVRSEAVAALKAGKIENATRLVTAAIKTTDQEPKEKEGQGTGIVLADPEPWGEPVDGGELLETMSPAFARFVVLPSGAATAASLWTLHAHAHDAAVISPLLTAVSPEKRCGKTTFLGVLQQLVPRPLPTSNVTPAALFRAVEKFTPVLLLDEADTYVTGKRANPELRGLINSGHRRSSAILLRCVGDDNEPRMFSTWAPKSIALIGSPPDTIRDRSILMSMRRRLPEERVERLRDADPELSRLCRMAARWSADRLEALRGADPETPEGLDDRAADNWRPLLAIADLAGGPWPERARRAALFLSGAEAAEDESVRVMLLADIREIFADREADRLLSSDIAETLAKRESRPWPEWGKNQKPISGRQIASLLSPFRIVPGTVRTEDARGSGYKIEQFEESFRRYLVSTACQRDNADGARVSAENASVTTDEASCGEDGRKRSADAGCHVVTDDKGVSGGEKVWI